MTQQVEYNAYEQDVIRIYERLAEQRRADPDSVTITRLEDARTRVENAKYNAQVRTQRLAEEEAKRKAARDKAAAEAEEARLLKVGAEAAAFKEDARARFPGTDSEFEHAWPAIKREWQKQQALGQGTTDEEELREYLRQRVGYGGRL